MRLRLAHCTAIRLFENLQRAIGGDGLDLGLLTEGMAQKPEYRGGERKVP